MDHESALIKRLKFFLLAGGVALGSAAFAGQLWIAVPSAMSGGQVVITGGGLSAGEAVTVRVTDPAGQTYAQSEVANAEGKLNVTLTPGASGRHTVEVKNAAGEHIGGGAFLYAP